MIPSVFGCAPLEPVLLYILETLETAVTKSPSTYAPNESALCSPLPDVPLKSITCVSYSGAGGSNLSILRISRISPQRSHFNTSSPSASTVASTVTSHSAFGL